MIARVLARAGRMVGRFVKNPPALLLVLLLGLLPLRSLAQSDDADCGITLGERAGGIGGIDWSASLAPDGRLSVRVEYRVSEGEPREFDIRVPEGARYLALDGTPISASIGRYATATVSGPAVITYELPGRIARYRDGALLQLAGGYDSGGTLRLDGDQAMFVCPRCYLDGISYGDTVLSGALYAHGAAQAELLFAGAHPVVTGTIEADEADDADEAGDAGAPASADATGDAITFVGNARGVEEVSLLAILPADAVPDVERSDGDVATAVEALRSQFTEDGDEFRAARRDGSGGTSGATPLLLVLFGGLIAAGLLRRVVIAARERQAQPAASSGGEVPRAVGRSAQPNALEPAMAALVVGEAGSGRRSAVAATILELARRDVISIHGSDTRRVIVTVPAGATGETAFERAVIREMRPLGVEPDPPKGTELTGPPLWHQRAPIVTRRLLRLQLLEGRRQRLIRTDPVLLAAAPVAIAMGVVALARSDDLTLHAWLAMIVGPVLAVLAWRRAGISLTATGTRERDVWLEYAEWLRGDPDLAGAAPSEVDTLGEPLVYAAALGAAPQVAHALSPTYSERR